MIVEKAPLKLGIIGCGWVTEFFHLPALQRVRNASVVAVADDDWDRLKRVAERFQVRRRYTDHKALLDDPAVEAVLVWLPADSQVEVAQTVLAAGKHLFIDKPLVFDLKVWDSLIEQAAQANRKIMVVGLPRRWHPLMRRVRRVVEQGTLGKIHFIRTVLTGRNAERRTMKELGARHWVRGLLYEHGIHHVDIVQTLLPSSVEEIFATSSPDGLTFLMNARLVDGVMVSSTFSEDESHNDEVEIYGGAGRLVVSCYRFDGFEYFPSAVHPGDLKTRVRQAVHTLKELPQGLLRIRQGGNFADSYRAGWQHCTDAIRQDTRPDCTLEDAIRALRVVLAARESVDLGRPVKLT